MKLTPTQARLMAVLQDGKPHTSKELERAIAIDEECSESALRNHIVYLRKQLRPNGEDLAVHMMSEVDTSTATIRRVTYYQHVRLLASPYKG